MKHEIMPVITASDLEEALRLQYGEEFMEDIEDNVSSFLFDTDYINDVCKKYSFDKLEEYTGGFWQNETRIRVENCIKTFLQDTFPGYERVIIDVSW